MRTVANPAFMLKSLSRTLKTCGTFFDLMIAYVLVFHCRPHPGYRVPEIILTTEVVQFSMVLESPTL